MDPRYQGTAPDAYNAYLYGNYVFDDVDLRAWTFEI